MWNRLGLILAVLGFSVTTQANTNPDVQRVKFASCQATLASYTHARRIDFDLADERSGDHQDRLVALNDAASQNTEQALDDDIAASGSDADVNVASGTITAVAAELELKDHQSLSERYSFFDLKSKADLSPRIFVDHNTGLIHFQQLAGGLKRNFEALIQQTRGTNNLIWNVSESHEVFSDVWTTGTSMYHIVNKMLAPYRTPDQLILRLYDGGNVGVFYQAQKDNL
jgi:hypothetical protein